MHFAFLAEQVSHDRYADGLSAIGRAKARRTNKKMRAIEKGRMKKVKEMKKDVIY